MRHFLIQYLYVSSGLKRTYHKKLEVFGGVLNGTNFIADTLHSYKKGVWVEKPIKNPDICHVGPNEIRSDITGLEKNRWNSDLVFTSLDLAKAAKLITIQKLGVVYAEELVRLRELYDRNVPDIKAPLAEMYAEYPEYFV
jgi:hypothetical protein